MSDIDTPPEELAGLEMMWSSLRTQLDAHRPGRSAIDPAPEAELVPVTILTGFLGSGKSTLLAKLLTDFGQHMMIRAVVNDVGTLPFDPTLIETADEIEIELANGCGCCVSTSDLAATLDRLADSLLDAESETEDEASPDRRSMIVLEASGVADPLALAQVVEANSKLMVDRIVTAVDGQMIEKLRPESGIAPIVARQLDAAHCIVVTHADRLTEAQRRKTLSTIAESVPGRIIAMSSLDSPAAETLTPSSIRGARLPVESEGVEHGLPTVTVTQAGPLKRSRLESLLAGRPSDAVRGKGRLLLDDGYAFVQFTPTTTSIVAAEAGPCGFTIVASTVTAASSLADLIAVTE